MDRRQEILLQELRKAEVDSFPQGIYNAMDEHGKEIALFFLRYVLKNMGGHSVDAFENVEIKYNNEWLTPEQLFENFL